TQAPATPRRPSCRIPSRHKCHTSPRSRAGLVSHSTSARLTLNASDFRAVVSGERRGLTAALCRAALGAAEFPYTAAVRWRNRRYDRGRKPIERVGVPVVSVGNLTLGGTGKTPMVEWLARWFRARNVRVTIISRGYGAEAGGRNDEALELEQRL